MTPEPRNTTLIGIVVTFVVVTGLVLGIGLVGGRVANRSAADPPPPRPLTTPTLAPSSRGVPARNPPPPPVIAPPRLDPESKEWGLPRWRWDELPALAEGADENWAALQVAELAVLEPPALTGCAVPAAVEDQQDYENAVRRQWRCVHEAWRPILADMGWPTREPVIRFYRGAGGRSACGYVEAPAFYCNVGEGTAHFGGDDMDAATFWEMTINETVNHEYAHHVQNLAGIMDAAELVARTDDVGRRLELQASCLAGAMTIRNTAVHFDQRRWDDYRQSLLDALPDREHGTRESLVYWSTRGLYAATLGDCNTWSVAPERVS